MDVAGIVLVGGQSTRMGVPKATLPFGPELMIQRVLRVLVEATSSVVVVAAPDQMLPSVPVAVRVVHDRRKGRGPLEGIRAGLEALQGHCDAAYVTGCDVPTLKIEFIRLLTGRLEGHRIAVPVDGPHYHPLAAVYRINVLAEVRALLAADRLRPACLFQAVDTCRVPVDELRSVDPDLSSLENLNRPEEYFAALARCGFDVDENLLRVLPGPEASAREAWESRRRANGGQQ